jgi:hypothetical protein
MEAEIEIVVHVGAGADAGVRVGALGYFESVGGVVGNHVCVRVVNIRLGVSADFGTQTGSYISVDAGVGVVFVFVPQPPAPAAPCARGDCHPPSGWRSVQPVQWAPTYKILFVSSSVAKLRPGIGT